MAIQPHHVQVAKYLGARVIAAANSDGDAHRIQKIGADETVNYTRKDVEKTLKKLTHKLGVDVVFESVGEITWHTTLSHASPIRSRRDCRYDKW